MQCPKDCYEDRKAMRGDIAMLFERSIPCWMRNLFVYGLLTSFVLYGALWVYVGATYQTRSDAQFERSEVSKMQDKLDRIMMDVAAIKRNGES